MVDDIEEYSDEEMEELKKLFPPEQIAAVEAFIQSIQPELSTLGSEGDIYIDWENKKILARADNGNEKEFDFSHLNLYLKNNLQ